MVKMIVLDLDGTLLNSEKKVSEISKKYLKKLKDLGYIIVIASGRIYESVNNALDGFEYVNYIITDTGASCYDVRNGSTIFNNLMSIETAKKFKKYYNENCIFIDVCDKHTIYKYSDYKENYYFIDTTKDWDYIFNNCKEISHISVNNFFQTISKMLSDLIRERNIFNFSNIETIKKEYKVEYFLTLETSLFIGRVISNTLFICMAFLSADFIMNIFIIFVILQAISVIKLQFDMNKYNNIR